MHDALEATAESFGGTQPQDVGTHPANTIHCNHAYTHHSLADVIQQEAGEILICRPTVSGCSPAHSHGAS